MPPSARSTSATGRGPGSDPVRHRQGQAVLLSAAEIPDAAASARLCRVAAPGLWCSREDLACQELDVSSVWAPSLRQDGTFRIPLVSAR